jgi:RimJ/RimL family protein N-acetyltransferase
MRFGAILRCLWPEGRVTIRLSGPEFKFRAVPPPAESWQPPRRPGRDDPVVSDTRDEFDAEVVTPRLLLRPTGESDRERFVNLFRDPAFMVFSAGVMNERAAHDRFDRMVSRCTELTFAKQPVIERATGFIVGYSGVDRWNFDGRSWLEYGYRLCAGSPREGVRHRGGCSAVGEGAALDPR